MGLWLVHGVGLLDGFETMEWLLVLSCIVVASGAAYWAGSGSSRALKVFDATIAGLMLLLVWSVLADFVASA